MDVSDIFAVLTYIILIFALLNFYSAFVADIDTDERMFRAAIVFFIGAWIFGIITVLTVSGPTPSQVIKVERYNSYSTEKASDGTIYHLGNNRTLKYEDSDDSNINVVAKDIYGKKPKCCAKLVIKGFSDAQKAKLRANSWNFAKLMRTYNNPDDKLYTLHLYNAK